MSARDQVSALKMRSDRNAAVIELWDLAQKLADLVDRVRWEGDWTYACRREYEEITKETIEE